MPVDYLDRLSRFVSETRLQDFDRTTVTAAKTVVLDTIGAILAGSRLPENGNLAKLATIMGNGPSTVLANPHSAQPVFATLVNATSGVALEMDKVAGWVAVTLLSTLRRRHWQSQRRSALAARNFWKV